ncbi:MAG: hypothetical protein VX899_00165 [Myxococcota bacterium]|nr:hypothetical protein [Myxococcota bacterium]
MSFELESMVDDVVGRAWALARQRTGRLAAITVSVPQGADTSLVAKALSSRLETVGLPEVEVEVLHSDRPPRLLALEFERWRA